MDVALLAEGTYPYHPGGVSVWCDQLIRGLAPHRFTVHAITASDDIQPTWVLPDNVDGVHSVALWGSSPTSGRRVRSAGAGSAGAPAQGAPWGQILAGFAHAADSGAPSRTS